MSAATELVPVTLSAIVTEIEHDGRHVVRFPAKRKERVAVLRSVRFWRDQPALSASEQDMLAKIRALDPAKRVALAMWLSTGKPMPSEQARAGSSAPLVEKTINESSAHLAGCFMLCYELTREQMAGSLPRLIDWVEATKKGAVPPQVKR